MAKDKLTSPLGVFGDPCVVASNTGDFYFLHLSDPEAWDGEATPCWTESCANVPKTGASRGLAGWHGSDSAQGSGQGMGGGVARWNRIHACWTQFDKYGSQEPGDSTVILCSHRRQGQALVGPCAGQRPSWGLLGRRQHRRGCCSGGWHASEVYVAWALGSWIYFDKSLDGGLTWSGDQVVGEIAGGWDQTIPGIGRVNGMPVTQVDHSQGPHRGRIYINWTDTRNGDTDV